MQFAVTLGMPSSILRQSLKETYKDTAKYALLADKDAAISSPTALTIDFNGEKEKFPPGRFISFSFDDSAHLEGITFNPCMGYLDSTEASKLFTDLDNKFAAMNWNRSRPIEYREGGYSRTEWEHNGISALFFKHLKYIKNKDVFLVEVRISSKKLHQQCENPTVKILDFGVYEGEIDSQHEEQGVAAGYNNMSYDKRLIQSTTSIIGKEDLNFGFRYLLQCAGYNPEEVPVTIRVLHPKMRNPINGNERTLSEWTDNAFTSYLNYHSGFIFNEPWEIVAGNWTIQVFHKEQKLAEKSFSVITP